jgi:hypothetical protein
VPEVPAVVRDRRSVWIHGGNGDITAVVVDTYEDFRSADSVSVAYYCSSPRQVPPAVMADKKLVALICPTSSPFSHDANLMRSLVDQRGITAVCGLRLEADDMKVTIALTRSRSVIELGRTRIHVAQDLAGSDEALGYLASRKAICYRPYYLYDTWIGQRVTRGLEAGVGRLVIGPSARALMDTDGRIWLLGGPTPGTIAGWIFNNPFVYLDMLSELTCALHILTSTSWEPSLILSNPQFLAALDVNFRVAPLVGFPLYSITRLAESSLGAGDDTHALESRVATVSQLVPIGSRQRGTFDFEVFDTILKYFVSLSESPTVAGIDIAAAAVLMSDVRRMVIDGLRQNYPAFKEHTRHRSRS